MNTALLYLSVRLVRGRILRTLRLLREPKYLIGLLAFVAWIGFWMSSALLDDDVGNTRIQFANAELLFDLLGDGVPTLHVMVAALLALLVSLWWLVPWSRMALNLNEAEIHMLTPMPIARRDLIQYATLKSQPGILFGCTMMTLFLGAGGPVARAGWFVAFWVVLTLWDLHSKGRALWLERQKELPRERAWRNRVLLVIVIASYWIVLGSAFSEVFAELVTLRPAAEQSGVDFVRQTLATYGPRLQSGVIGWLLSPFRWITAPLFIAAPGADAGLRVAGIVTPLLLLVAHNEWVVRSRAKFEEAALAHARREATKADSRSRYWKTSMRARRRSPFPLAPTGAPELAVLWKNSMIVTRFAYRTLALFGLGVIGLSLLVPIVLYTFQGTPLIILSIGFMTMALSPLTGSQSYRNDLRADLLRVEMVRPWPIEGWRMFAAQCAGPTVFATMTALLGAGLVLAMDLYMTFERLTLMRINSGELSVTPAGVAEALGVPGPLLTPLLLLGVLPLLLAVTCLSTTLQNLLVLLFPGWVQLGSRKQEGAAAFGQNMIMFFGLGLAGLVCLVPAVLLVGIIVALQTLVFGIAVTAWEFPALGIIAATPVFAVVAVIVRAGGRVWDNLDPSREILEGSA